MRWLVLILTLCIMQNAIAQNTSVSEEDTEDSGVNFRLGISAGAAVMDGVLYNQIGIRPLISIGKLGIALDLSLYMDADGKIRKENWDEPGDLFEKIYYVRWARPGDPFYLKVGAIDNYRLGYGLLMNRYANTVEYPNVIRTGMEIGIQNGATGFQGMINNFSELVNGGGVMAGRMAFKVAGDLEIGISAVVDINQYKGLKDKDDDGVPDFVDDFPNRKKYQVDTDGDGIPDEKDSDINGDGYTDNSQDPLKYPNNQSIDSITVKEAPFNVNDAEEKTQLAYAIDIGYPFVNTEYLQLVVYSQFAQFALEGGWGATLPGVRAKFGIVNAFAEYRIFDEKFIPEYFNTTYELERAVLRGDSIRTKRETLELVNEALTGYVIGADFNIADFMIFGAEYQDMSKNKIEFKTLRANLDLNTNIIPKIRTAGAYFYQNNTSLKKIFSRTEGTIMGYKIGYDIGGGAALVLDFRQTFRDRNGDGKIKGPNEVIESTIIQTVFAF